MRGVGVQARKAARVVTGQHSPKRPEDARPDPAPETHRVAATTMGLRWWIQAPWG